VKKIPMLAMGVMVAALMGAGCKTQMPKASGFLSDYSHLTESNDSTWQYVDAGALASYDKLIIPPVKIMSSDYWGSAFTDEQRQKLANTFQQKLTAALGKKYQVVTAPGASTAELRVAITRAYRVGNSLAIGVEAEAVASDSRKQLAALSGVKIGPPEMSINTSARAVNDPSDPGTYMAGWWNRPAADELLSRWTEQTEKLLNAGSPKK
jgi:hypothetical protein